MSENATHAPKQKLVVLSEFCTRAAGSDCDRCSHCCPHNAISLPEGNAAPTVAHEHCTGCGICFGICDAFASTRMTMVDLHARMKRIAQDGERVYITCNDNVFPGFEVAHNVVVLPCLSLMSPELWTLILAEGIRVTIACDLKYCEDCERGGSLGGELFGPSIKLAEERTGEKVLFTFRIPEKQTILEKYSENSTSERREVFTEFVADAAEIASGKRRLHNSELLKDYYLRKERHRAALRLHFASESPYKDFTPEGRGRRLMFPKQQLVLDAIDARPDIAENIPIALSETDASRCEADGNCVSSCPTGARFLSSASASGPTLAFDPRLCVGCGICVDACVRSACRIAESTASAYLNDESPQQAH